MTTLLVTTSKFLFPGFALRSSSALRLIINSASAAGGSADFIGDGLTSRSLQLDFSHIEAHISILWATASGRELLVDVICDDIT